MAKISLLLIFELTLLNFVFGQEEELPLAFSETIEYLQQDGKPIRKTVLLDLTGDEPVEIVIWRTKTNINGLKRTRDSGIVDGDTLIEVSIEQFDTLGNLILKIDSSNNRLESRTEFEYLNSRLIQKYRFGDYLYSPSDSTYFAPTTSTTTFIYEDDKLTKEIKTEQGGLFSSNETVYSTLYDYIENELTEIEYYLSNSDTLSVTKHFYDQKGYKISSTSDSYNETWKYDSRGNVVEEFLKANNMTQRTIYIYNSFGKLVKKETYLKQ